MNEYPHMCRDGHDEVGWRGDGEMCPACVVKAELLAALKNVERHHVMLNGGVGRNEECSTTLRIVRDAIAKAEVAAVAK